MQTTEILSNFDDFAVTKDKLAVVDISEAFKFVGIKLDDISVENLLRLTGLKGRSFVSRDELEKIARAHFKNTDIESEMQTTMHVFDTTGSGKANLSEIVNTLNEIGTSQSRIDEIVSEITVDQNGEFDYAALA
jgi:Ca2+-binding EF-hand superfamily protein